VIGAVVKAWIASRPEIDNLVGGRVFPNRARQKQTAGADAKILYTLIEAETVRNLRGSAGLSFASYHLEIQAQEYDSVEAISKAIVGTRAVPGLDGFRGTLAGIYVQRVLVVDATDQYQDPRDASDFGVFKRILEAKFWYGS
jgi:hypothetical protein